MNRLLLNAVLPTPHQHIVERQALLEKLNLAPRHKLTLIAAPPGYGKTTVVAQFARRTGYPIVWHLVEEKERDSVHLLAHSVETLQQIFPDLAASPGETALEGIERIIEYIRTSAAQDIIYVWDDVHHLIGSPDSEHWLQTFIAGVSSNCHLILIGRALPTLPLVDMIARGEVLALGQEQLRFTFSELETVAHQLDVAATASDIHRIMARFDGWPAGSVLALQPLPDAVEAALFSGKHGPEASFDALADVMLHAQPVWLQDFLLASATLARMTPALCQVILGIPESRERFTEVLNRNIFTSQTPGSVTYHPLFRDFLQRYLESHDPKRFISLHERAARWFEANNRLDEAFDHYVRAHRLQYAAAIAERSAQVYFSDGKIETILYWRSELRHAAVQAPRLLYTCAMIHVDRYEYRSATKVLILARAGFEKNHDELGALQVMLLEANIANQSGEYQLAIQLAESLQKRADVPLNLEGYMRFILGTAYLHSGDNDRAIQEFGVALPLYRSVGDAHALSHLLLSFEMATMRVGRFAEASAFLQEAIEIRRVIGNEAGLLMPLNNLGYDYHLLGEYDLAQKTFEEALQIAKRASEKRSESYLLWSIGDLHRDTGDFSLAMSEYQRALHLAGASEPSLRCNLLVSLSTLQRWLGNVEDALRWAAEGEATAQRHDLPFEGKKAQLARWACRGDAQLALPEMEEIANYFGDHRASTERSVALVLCASAALQQHKSARVSQFLSSAGEGVVHFTNLQPGIAEIVHTPELKEFVQQYQAKYSALLEGIDRLETAQVESLPVDGTSSGIDAVPTYSLRLWTLGQERFERDGTPVPVSAWRAAAARELVVYLLFKGATTREQLGLVLWPDNSSLQVRQKFHTTLHRVRNAIGSNTIRFEDELYSLNPAIDVWCDAIEFAGLVHEARLTSPLRAHTENLWRRAVSLYQGEFLATFDAEWVTPHREALDLMYLEALCGLGNCIRARGNFPDAITTYQRALNLDPYREDIHRAILTCYASLGERSLVRRHVDKLTRLLNAELGIEPSVETLALAQSLLATQKQ